MEENVQFEKYEKHYSEDGFWEKMKVIATKAGSKIIYLALKLYYASKNSDVPVWAKSAIIGALGYLILPIDLVPDVLPVAGLTDDLGVLLAALATITHHITPENKLQAKQKMKVWFGENEIATIDD